MAVNPLIVFVGLSVTTLGGLVIVTQQNRQHSADVPVVVQKQQTAIPEPETKPAPVPVISGKAVTKKTAVKKLASLPPKQQPVNPATKTANKLGQIPPAPIPGPAVIAPSFDVVRVEEDGGAVVVGKAASDTDVVLKLNGKIIGKARANGNGDWVFVPDQLVPKGSHELIVEATGKDKKTIRSKQSIIISMPKDANAKPLIVVSKPDAPSRILQAPETAKKVEAAKPATVVKAVKAADAPKTAPVAAASPATKTTVIAKTSVPVKTTGTKTATKAETASKPAVEEGKPVVKKVASLPTEAPKPVIKTETATTTAKPAAKLSAKPAAKTPGTPSAYAGPGKLSFGSVDYNDDGDIVFSGKAAAGAIIRLYVDNGFAGEAVANKSGSWVFRGRGAIKPGNHQLRADQVTSSGSVAMRTAVPFVRANPNKVAAFLKMRAKETAKTAPPVKVATVEPAKAPTIATKNPVKKVAKTAKKPAVAEKTMTKKSAVKETITTTAKVAAPVAGKIARDKPVDVVKNAADAASGKTSGQKANAGEKMVVAKAPISKTPTSQTATTQAPTDQGKDNGTATQKAENQELVSHVLIQPGNNLWNISRVIYGKGIAYTTIYQANKEQIKNPNRIYPGQILTTPGATSPGSIDPRRRKPLDSVTASTAKPDEAVSN